MKILEIRDQLKSLGWKIFPQRAEWGGKKNPNIQPPSDNDFRWNKSKHLIIAVPPGVIVIDYDGHKREDAVTIDELEQKIGMKLPEPFQYKQHDSGISAHYVFRIPESLDVKNVADWLPGVDIRVFGGALNIKPDKKYNFINQLEIVELCDKGIKSLPIVYDEPQHFTKSIVTDKSTKYGLKAIDNEVNRLINATKGTRETTFNTVALKLFRLSAGGELTNDDVSTALLYGATSNGWLKDVGIKTVKDKINHCMNDASTQPKTSSKKIDKIDAASVFSSTVEDSQILVDFKKCLYSNIKDIPDVIQPIITQESIDKLIDISFWSAAKSKMCVLGENNYVKMYERKDCFKHLVKEFGHIIVNLPEFKQSLTDCVKRLEPDSKKVRQILNDITNISLSQVFIDYQITNRQRETKTYIVDMFAEKSSIEIKNNTALIKAMHKKFKENIKYKNDQIIDDYKIHFPDFDNVLEFIVNSRFAPDRKNSYLWFYCESDWGKSLFKNVLSKSCGAVNTSLAEVQCMLQGRPAGLTPEDFIDTIAICIDEFSSINKELKQLENEINFSPKHGLNVTVPVYSKLLFSAENVNSLNGEYGMEDQYKNRISIIRGSGSIKDRELFKKVGSNAYFQALVHYTANFVNVYIDKMKAMGRDESARIAELKINEFHSQNGADKYCDTMSENIQCLADDFIQYCRDDTYSQGKVVIEGDTMFIRSPGSFYDKFLQDCHSAEERKTLLKKKAEVYEKLQGYPSIKLHRLSSAKNPVKCIKVKI